MLPHTFSHSLSRFARYTQRSAEEEISIAIFHRLYEYDDENSKSQRESQGNKRQPKSAFKSSYLNRMSSFSNYVNEIVVILSFFARIGF